MQARGLNICATVAWGVYTTADGSPTFVEIAADWRGPDVDPDTLRLGHYRAVNHGGGVRPERVSKRGGTLTARFPVEGTGLEENDGVRQRPRQGTAGGEDEERVPGRPRDRGAVNCGTVAARFVGC